MKGFKLSNLLNIIGLNKSTFFYMRTQKNEIKGTSTGRPIPGYSLDRYGKKVCDEQIKEYISEISEGEGYCYGYYKITIILKRKYDLIIDDKKVYRLCGELHILKLKTKRSKRSAIPRKIAINRIITGINQLWEVDLKYGYIEGEDKFFYLLEYIDVYDRNIVAYHIGLSCLAEDAVFTLNEAIKKRQIKQNTLVVRSDNGPQFIGSCFYNSCKELKIEHERIPVNTPNKNAHIESFHRLLEDDCLSRYEFMSYGQAYEICVNYFDYYQNTRIHSSLKYLSPAEFTLKLQTGEIKGKDVKL